MQPPASFRRSRRGPADLRECQAFTNLAERARKRNELDRRLRLTLPANIREQVRLADFRQGCLIFLAPSPAWATRLRLSQTQLLAQARAMGVAARSMSVKVVPPKMPAVAEPPRQKPLSPVAAERLKTAAMSLSDPELRDLFLAMASIAASPDSPDRTD